MAPGDTGSDGAAVDEVGLGPGSLPHDAGDEVAQVGFPFPDLLSLQVHLCVAAGPMPQGLGLAFITGHNLPDPGVGRSRGRADLL